VATLFLAVAAICLGFLSVLCFTAKFVLYMQQRDTDAQSKFACCSFVAFIGMIVAIFAAGYTAH
jgi:uncharacterized membrane protein